MIFRLKKLLLDVYDHLRLLSVHSVFSRFFSFLRLCFSRKIPLYLFLVSGQGPMFSSCYSHLQFYYGLMYFIFILPPCFPACSAGFGMVESGG